MATAIVSWIFLQDLGGFMHNQQTTLNVRNIGNKKRKIMHSQ